MIPSFLPFRFAVVFSLLVSATMARATVQISLQASMPDGDILASYAVSTPVAPTTLSGLQWRNDTVNGRRDVGESFYAAGALTLEAFGLQVYPTNTVQSGDPGAAVTLSIFQSASATSIGTLYASEGGTFPSATPGTGAGDWLAFDLTDLSLDGGYYYTMLVSFDVNAASRGLVLADVINSDYTAGQSWQYDGTTYSRSGANDLNFYVQGVTAAPEPRSMALTLLGGAVALLAWVRRRHRRGTESIARS